MDLTDNDDEQQTKSTNEMLMNKERTHAKQDILLSKYLSLTNERDQNCEHVEHEASYLALVKQGN